MFFRTGSPQNLVLVLFMALGVTAGPVGRLTGELEQTLQHIAEKTGTENDESGRSDRLLLSVILQDFSILLHDIAVAIERGALQGEMILSQYLPPSTGQSATDHGPESNENIGTNDENNEIENVATNDGNNDENIANNDENDGNNASNNENDEVENVATNDENNADIASNNENNENIANNDENDENIASNNENDENIASNNENDENIATNNEYDENIASNDENGDNIANNMPSLGANEEEGTPFHENHDDEASQPAATDDAVPVGDESVISTDDFASAGSSREWSPFDENVATLGRGGPSVSIQRPHTHAGRHGGDSEAPDDAAGRHPFSGRWSPFSSDAPSFGKHPPHPHARPSGRHLPPHSPANSQPEVQQARWLELINKMRKPKANPASVVGRWSPFDKNPPTFGRNPAG
ncbi:hypothetical protein Bbelb_164360 [Branchiostoma belcheri]|nr:hypothetical protein Bbelb_164360 [Branchiostoma belcheri]